MSNVLVDTLVIGSGIAGLSAALEASRHGSVALVTKATIQESNTRYAQGGIAAVTAAEDDVGFHVADTINAGVGLCNEAAVDLVCTEGPQRVFELMKLGVQFDYDGDQLARGLEGAHSHHRILHAGGDATGAVIVNVLSAAARRSNLQIYEDSMLVDFIVEHSRVVGGLFVSPGCRALSIRASATVLATGGAGQLFSYTTNPTVATGDGVAAAFRAGALLSDLEFMQFHPTAAVGKHSFLISEAVRGEGAVLRNADGHRFMDDVDPRGELAPRDIVARAIAFEMAKQGGKPVFLDATAKEASFLAKRFPTIDALCAASGLDWAHNWVPVTPAAHYWMGGVKTDLCGRTSLQGLYAIGEVAANGVHGANRLASNSLLDGLVFAHEAVRHIVSGASVHSEVLDDVSTVRAVSGKVEFNLSRQELQNAMWEYAGVYRDSHSLELLIKAVTRKLDDASLSTESAPVSVEAIEDRNLTLLAYLMAISALERKESRGAHFRSDYQFTNPRLDYSQSLVRAR